MKNLRISAFERKKSILEAVLPLFGKKGFTGSSTRELAKAAQVSDALLYKYFPSKAAIYKALMDFCCKSGENIGAELQKLEPSTETLVFSLYFLMVMIVDGAPNVKKHKLNLDRLLLQSLASDGAFARGFYDSKLLPWIPPLEEADTAAKKSCDINDSIFSSHNNIWFVHHVAMALLFFRIPKKLTCAILWRCQIGFS